MDSQLNLLFMSDECGQEVGQQGCCCGGQGGRCSAAIFLKDAVPVGLLSTLLVASVAESSKYCILGTSATCSELHQGCRRIYLFARWQLSRKLGPMTKLLSGSFTSTAHWCPRCGHTHIWSNFSPIIPNHLNILKPQMLGALITGNSLLNLKTNFYPDWTKNY